MGGEYNKETRTVTDEELDSYILRGENTRCNRRWAETHEEVGEQFIVAAEEGIKPCFTCKHTFAYLSWRCERLHNNLPCKWESCYVKEDLTKH